MSASTSTDSHSKKPETEPVKPASDTSEQKPPDMSNILSHIKNLETSKLELEQQLKDRNERIDRLSQKTREGMQSALDTLMKKWMDAVETKDEKIKHDFRGGLEKLVKNSAEENGVWQMMVAASALHQRQEHNLDELTKQNNELKLRVDGMYANPDSRVVGEKSKAEDQLDRSSVPANDIWSEFASSIGGIH